MLDTSKVSKANELQIKCLILDKNIVIIGNALKISLMIVEYRIIFC
jgi:hypothetical protein